MERWFCTLEISFNGSDEINTFNGLGQIGYNK